MKKRLGVGKHRLQRISGLKIKGFHSYTFTYFRIFEIELKIGRFHIYRWIGR
jgi:hypothetical protein